MPQSLACLLVHLVFSTRERRRFIMASLQPEVGAYMGWLLADEGSPAIAIGVQPEHVHVLLSLAKTSALCDVVELVKKRSSKWLKTKGAHCAKFSWQVGYSAFSVSPSRRDEVEAYIRGQAEHHATRTFQDELRAFLVRHGVAFDERYLWD